MSQVISRKRLAKVLAGLIAISFVISAQAEDEFLSILGDSSGAQTQQVKSVLRKVLGTTTAEQNIFLQFFEKNEMDKALYQWPSAFDNTTFSKTANGRALHALVLFKNGVHVVALENLLSIGSPAAIAPELIQLWKEAAPDRHEAWSFVNAKQWNKAWADVFGVATEVRVVGREVYSPEQQETIKELIRKTPRDTRERAWLEWQMVLAMALNDDAGTAAKGLAVLMKSANNAVGQDLMTMTAARLLFQNGFLDAAIKYYSQVPKSSDDWFDAQEEMAWAHIRKGEPQDAIAVTKSLTSPLFASQVGPEAIFLRSLAQLKVCDYPAVTETLKTFGTRYRERAKNMIALTESAESPVVKTFIAQTKKSPMKLMELKADAAKLPRFITRDEVLLHLIKTESRIEAESQRVGELYARSLSGGTSQVGFQARLEELRKAMDTRVVAARSASYGRIKTLAQEELSEIGQMLQKMHIVEAEVLQQLTLAGRVSAATDKMQISQRQGSTGSKSVDSIWFPAESETWFDELANYRVDIKKDCQSAKR